VFNINGCAIENQVKFLSDLVEWSDKNLRSRGICNDLGNTQEEDDGQVLSFVANETKKVDKYISGPPNNIYGNVKSARPKTSTGNTNIANTQMGNGQLPRGMVVLSVEH
ncbi:hypothetical protein Tco_1187034, partial [Tanacetum coccineum]